MTDDSLQTTNDGGQITEDRGQKTEVFKFGIRNVELQTKPFLPLQFDFTSLKI